MGVNKKTSNKMPPVFGVGQVQASQIAVIERSGMWRVACFLVLHPIQNRLDLQLVTVGNIGLRHQSYNASLNLGK